MLVLKEELKKSYTEKFVGRRLQMIVEEETDGYCVGYSENYIRLYVKRKIDGKKSVVAKELFKDGLLAEPID